MTLVERDGAAVVEGPGRLPVARRVDQRDVNIASLSQRGKKQD
jgi:hypothetical protein